MTKRVLIPIPRNDFDPTECAVPWKILSEANIKITFATPDGAAGVCDQRMLKGSGLGPLAFFLAADARAREAYQSMAASPEFQNPLHWDSLRPQDYDGLLLPGGHAPGMKEYLEASQLKKIVQYFFKNEKPVGAICHGVVLVARSQDEAGQSVLRGRKTTALLASQELCAWALTCLWLGKYYRTYPQTVEAEVRSQLAQTSDFVSGATPLLRDKPAALSRGFVFKDKNYISARWPGDAHRFAHEFLNLLFSP